VAFDKIQSRHCAAPDDAGDLSVIGAATARVSKRLIDEVTACLHARGSGTNLTCFDL